MAAAHLGGVVIPLAIHVVHADCREREEECICVPVAAGLANDGNGEGVPCTVTHLTSTGKISSGYMAAPKTTMTLGTCGAAAVGTANERSIRALAYGDSDQCSY